MIRCLSVYDYNYPYKFLTQHKSGAIVNQYIANYVQNIVRKSSIYQLLTDSCLSMYRKLIKLMMKYLLKKTKSPFPPNFKQYLSFLQHFKQYPLFFNILNNICLSSNTLNVFFTYLSTLGGIEITIIHKMIPNLMIFDKMDW